VETGKELCVDKTDVLGPSPDKKKSEHMRNLQDAQEVVTFTQAPGQSVVKERASTSMTNKCGGAQPESIKYKPPR